jgi:uncharacterized protein with GYD domain
MYTYITLLTFTDRGAQQVKKTVARAEAFRKMAEERGINISQTFWLSGPFDGIHIFKVENEDKAMAHSYSLSSFGNVKTQTFRALTKDEVEPILKSIPDPYDLLRAGRS